MMMFVVDRHVWIKKNVDQENENQGCMTTGRSFGAPSPLCWLCGFVSLTNTWIFPRSRSLFKRTLLFTFFFLSFKGKNELTILLKPPTLNHLRTTLAMATTKQPVFFISHGGNSYTVHFLFWWSDPDRLSFTHIGPDLLENKGLPGTFYTWFGTLLKNELKPKAIVIISAHWQGKGRNGIYGKQKKKVALQKCRSLTFDLVDTSEKPSLIYDFYGFPKHYYEETWDHTGEPDVASKVIHLLNKVTISLETFVHAATTHDDHVGKYQSRRQKVRQRPWCLGAFEACHEVKSRYPHCRGLYFWTRRYGGSHQARPGSSATQVSSSDRTLKNLNTFSLSLSLCVLFLNQGRRCRNHWIGISRPQSSRTMAQHGETFSKVRDGFW